MIKIFNLINLLKTLCLFKTSYSNNVFLDPLSKEEEEKYLDLFLNKKDQNARNKLIEHKAYIRENGQDLEEIRNWTWQDSMKEISK